MLAGIVLALLPAAAVAQDKTPPYWASIASGQAMMRTGPGRNFPGVWLYQRRDLPIRVLKVFPNWRYVEDPDGVRGWMLVTLLSDRRTAIVRGAQARPLYASPNETSRLKYRVEPGVVGRVDNCANGWCEMKVGGDRSGYVRITDIWGVSDGETVD